MEFNKEELLKSPLNYTGGKYKLLPQILPLFPDNIDTFVDLFAGGCNVGINVKAKKVICNDYLKQLIDLYTYLKEHSVEEIYSHINSRIEEFDLSMTNKDGYLRMRECYNQNRNPLDLYVCICYAFNNSIRFNSSGEYNIAFGKDRSCFNSALQDRLKTFIEKLEDITFINKSFEAIKVDKLKSGDFVYADPPYLITDANYNENGGWGEDKENELLKLLDNLNTRGIRFALSNVLEHKGKSNDILKQWIIKNNYHVHRLNFNYGNCNYQTKDKSKNSSIEVLVTNYDTKII